MEGTEVSQWTSDAAAELALLKDHVTGVTGGILAAVDGLLIGHDGGTEHDPHDLAALAAATYGIGRQTARVLQQGDNQHVAIRSDHGYYVVVAIGEHALLGVIAGSGLNLAQLHIELRTFIDRFDRITQAFIDGRATIEAEVAAPDHPEPAAGPPAPETTS